MAIALLSVATFFASRQIQQNKEKQEFTQLEQTLKDFASKAEQELGVPAQKETKSFCNREGEKFKTGKLYCGTRTGMNYSVNSSEDAKTKIEKLEAFINKHEIFLSSMPWRQVDRVNEWQKYGILEIQQTKTQCKLQASYLDTASNDISNYIGESKPGYFSWMIRCTDFASRAYYPEGY